MTVTEAASAFSVICFLVGLTTWIRGMRLAAQPRKAERRKMAYQFGFGGLFGTVALLGWLLDLPEQSYSVSPSNRVVFLRVGLAALIALIVEAPRVLAARRTGPRRPLLPPPGPGARSHLCA